MRSHPLIEWKVTIENGPKVVLKAACLDSNVGGNSQLYAGTSLELHLLIQLRLNSKNDEDWTIRRKSAFGGDPQRLYAEYP
jgi:hypothetical protein